MLRQSLTYALGDAKHLQVSAFFLKRLMNYNIMNIILDKLALEELQGRMKNINKEYHHTIVYIYDYIVVRTIKCEIGHSTDFYYNYRNSQYVKILDDRMICKLNCIICYGDTVIDKLPKNY